MGTTGTQFADFLVMICSFGGIFFIPVLLAGVLESTIWREQDEHGKKG